jgi:hypothetical protein
MKTPPHTLLLSLVNDVYLYVHSSAFQLVAYERCPFEPDPVTG